MPEKDGPRRGTTAHTLSLSGQPPTALIPRAGSDDDNRTLLMVLC